MLMSLRGGSEKKSKKFFIINRGGLAHFDWFTHFDLLKFSLRTVDNVNRVHVLAGGWSINALARMRASGVFFSKFLP